MGDTQARVGFGSSRDLGIPNNTMRASLSLAECLSMQKGWGYLNFRQQSPLSLGLVECLQPPLQDPDPRVHSMGLRLSRPLGSYIESRPSTTAGPAHCDPCGHLSSPNSSALE